MTALSVNKQPTGSHSNNVKGFTPISGLVDAVLSGLRYPVIALDGHDRIILINPAGEEFFKAGAVRCCKRFGAVYQPRSPRLCHD